MGIENELFADIHADMLSGVEQSHESIWRAWQRRNRAQEMGRTARRTGLVKIASIAVLALTAVYWGRASDYDVFVRFAVTAGAVYMAIRAFTARAHIWTTVFAGLAVLFNPIVSAVDFSDQWPLLVVLASIVPFVLSPALTPSISSQDPPKQVQ